MKGSLFIIGFILFFGCQSKRDTAQKMIRVDHQWLDSIKRSADTFYVKKYGTIKFDRAEYYLDKRNDILCQLMKDSLDSVRQVIITKNSKRSFFAEYYPNGQLMAQLLLDTFGQYHGHAKYYFPNGLVESEGDYNDGLKTGTWLYNDEMGKMISKSMYDANGQIINAAASK